MAGALLSSMTASAGAPPPSPPRALVVSGMSSLSSSILESIALSISFWSAASALVAFPWARKRTCSIVHCAAIGECAGW